MSKQHLNDTLRLPVTGLDKVTDVNMSISCNLMKNQLQASPVTPNKNMITAQDNNGHAIIFAIGADDIFRLLKYTNASSTGYTQVDLSSTFKGYDKAIAFDLSEDAAGNITIALALQKTGGRATDIFVAKQLSNDFSKTKWDNFSSLCTKVTGVDVAFIADHVRVGVAAEHETPLIVVAGSLKKNEFYYQIEKEAAVALQLPENVHKPTQIDLGYCIGQQGKFFLYNIGASQTLTCITLPSTASGITENSMTYDFSPNNSEIPSQYQGSTYNCIALAAGTNISPINRSSDLYVGTNKGIFLFKGGKIENGGFQVVSDWIKDVHQIVVKQTDDSISVWAMASPSNLYYIYGKKDGDNYTFNDAIVFDSNTIHIAPMRKKNNNANELYLLNTDENIVHYWQDPNSTLWNKRTIKVKDEDFLLNFNSFTTHITLTDQNGQALPHQKIQLKSSDWLFANINGKVYSLDKDVGTDVQTDFLGAINIIQMTEDIAPPILHIEADFLPNTINIYPNGKIQHGLAAIKTGADLKNAKDPDGKSVLTTSISDDNANGVANSLTQVTDAATKSKTGQHTADQLFVTLTAKGKPASGKINVQSLPDNFAVGMQLSNGKWTTHTNADFIKTGSIVSIVINAPGDALHWVGNELDEGINLIHQGVTELKDGVGFVIQKAKDALHFIVKIGEKLLVVVLEDMITVFKVLNKILALIGIDLDAILRWLGHLLGIDEIWESHKVIAAFLTNGLDYGVEILDEKLEDIKTFITNSFDQIEKTIENGFPQPSSSTKSQSLSLANHIDTPFNSSAGNWIFSQIAHHNLLGGGSDLSSHQMSSSANPIQQFYGDILMPTIASIAKDLEAIVGDFKDVLAGNIGDVYKLLPDLANLVLDPIKTILLGILDLAKDLLGDFKQLLEKGLDIPFLSSMYKLFSSIMGDEEKLTILNAVALIIAIPYTFVRKILSLSSNFKLENTSMASKDYFKNLFSSTSAPFLKTGSSASDYSQIGGLIASISAMAGIFSTMASIIASIREYKTVKKILSVCTTGAAMLSLASSFPLPSDEDWTAKAEIYRLIQWGMAGVGALVSIVDTIYAISSTVAELINSIDPPAEFAEYGIEKAVSYIFNWLYTATNAVSLFTALGADDAAQPTYKVWLIDVLSTLGGIGMYSAIAASELFGGNKAIALSSNIPAAIAIAGSGIAIDTIDKAGEDDILHIIQSAR